MTTALLWPWCLGLVGSFLAEALLRPAVARPWRRPLSTLLVHLGTWSLAFGLLVLIVQRPWFALVLFLALQLVVVQSSNAKSTTLREPFICQDFEYFLDAIRHPRLYVPFFGIGLAIGASLAGLAAIIGFLMIEPSLISRHGAGAFLLGGGMIVAASSLLLALALRQLPACQLEPAEDTHRLGLFSALWCYGLMTRQPLGEVSSAFAAAPDELNAMALPNLVVVQSESFFDPREWLDGLPHDLLPHFDRLKAESLYHGKLSVPAWGANTVRTETAVLTGLAPQALGIHRFNPYHQLARLPAPSLARELKRLGYRTICVHPYAASFYQRDRVMPRLGFDAFIDIEAFSREDYCGQYIGDLAVAEKVGSLLADTDNTPIFVFVISMENHGPLQLDDGSAGKAAMPGDNESAPLKGDNGELTSYLSHLRNADRMAWRLRQQLAASTRNGLLCWYGDHVPIMPNAYEHHGEPDGDTPYWLWSSRGGPRTPQASESLAAEQLSQRIWQTVIDEAQGARDGCDQEHRERA